METFIISIAYVNFDKQNASYINACKNGFKPHGFIPNLFKEIKDLDIFSIKYAFSFFELNS
jgi:hypothetical protein